MKIEWVEAYQISFLLCKELHLFPKNHKLTLQPASLESVRMECRLVKTIAIRLATGVLYDRSIPIR